MVAPPPNNSKLPVFPFPNLLDYLKSTLHRVSLPATDDRFTGDGRLTRARYSIPYFISPNSDTIIECLAECTNESNPAKYEPIVQREYRLMRGKLHYK
jgi:isopenicillin N synthase-like dioxygenase